MRHLSLFGTRYSVSTSLTLHHSQSENQMIPHHHLSFILRKFRVRYSPFGEESRRQLRYRDIWRGTCGQFQLLCEDPNLLQVPLQPPPHPWHRQHPQMDTTQTKSKTFMTFILLYLYFIMCFNVLVILYSIVRKVYYLLKFYYLYFAFMFIFFPSIQL